MLRLFSLLLGLLLGDTVLAQTPTPMQPRTREPYVAPEIPALPPAPETRPAPRPRTMLWWQPLPPGFIACSIDPQGRQACGNGIWLER